MNAIEVGMLLFQEIEAVRTNGSWRWEKRLRGPLSSEEVNAICKVAGCWCDNPSAERGEEVRFYTNQNHGSHGGTASW